MNGKIVLAAGLSAGVLAVMSTTLVAGEVTGLVIISPTTPGKYSALNDNFSAVKTAVDDNDVRTTMLESLVTTNGNIVLEDSTASTGNILKGTTPFIHNFGLHNTFIGAGAGNFTMTGHSNTASGAEAFVSDTSGGQNTAHGVSALFSNTTGNLNNALGESALYNNTTGSSNIAIGQGALYNNTVGNGNIAIGNNAGYSLMTGSSNITIGTDGVASESNTIRMGSVSTQTATFIAGIRGVTTGFADAVNVMVDSAGQLGTVSSSRRVKDDIADMGETSGALMQLRPVTFHYKTDQNPEGRALQYGLIAEEVAEVAPGLVARSADGQPETVYYQFLAPMLLNEYQKQQRTIAEQAAQLSKQAMDIAELKEQAAHITRVLMRLEKIERLTMVSR